MIIRRGPNVRYSHDREALLLELLGMQEFSGVSPELIEGWLDGLSMYDYSRDFMFHKPTKSVYQPTYWVVGVDVDIVTLWNVNDAASRLILDHGFSCVVCHSRTPFDKRGRVYGALESAVYRRQKTNFPPLICIECAIDIPMMLSGMISEKRVDRAADRLIARSVAR